MTAKNENLRERINNCRIACAQALKDGNYPLYLKFKGKLAKAEEDLWNLENRRPLSEVLTNEEIKSEGLVDLILDTLLAMDFCNDCFFQLRSKLNKMHIVDCDAMKYADECERLSRQYMDRFCKKQMPATTAFLANNEDLIDKMHEFVDEYKNLRFGK